MAKFVRCTRQVRATLKSVLMPPHGRKKEFMMRHHDPDATREVPVTVPENSCFYLLGDNFDYSGWIVCPVKINSGTTTIPEWQENIDISDWKYGSWDDIDESSRNNLRIARNLIDEKHHVTFTIPKNACEEIR